jgi:hypothetical protein
MIALAIRAGKGMRQFAGFRRLTIAGQSQSQVEARSIR